MDIVKGFFQQTIRKSDRWKTAFATTHRGHEQLTVSTMGLANSPGLFQHRMETTFGRTYRKGSWYPSTTLSSFFGQENTTWPISATPHSYSNSQPSRYLSLNATF